MNTTFPSWFNHYSAPYISPEPQRMYTRHETVKELRISRDDFLKFDDLNCEGAEGVSFNYDEENYEIVISFVKLTEYKNPRYKENKAAYDAQQVRLAEWQRLKKIYDKEKAEDDLVAERTLYEKLRAKFDPVVPKEV